MSAGLDGVKNNGKSKKAKIVKVDYNSQSNVEIMVRTYPNLSFVSDSYCMMQLIQQSVTTRLKRNFEWIFLSYLPTTSYLTFAVNIANSVFFITPALFLRTEYVFRFFSMLNLSFSYLGIGQEAA